MKWRQFNNKYVRGVDVGIDISDRTKAVLAGVLIGVLSVLIIITPIFLFVELGESWINVFSVISTTLLTLFLVVLYTQQYRLLNRQTNLMRREYQSTISISPRVGADDRKVITQLKNTGRGNIQRLILKSEIIGQTSDIEISPAKSVFVEEGTDNQMLPANSEGHKFGAIPRLKHDSDSNENNVHRLKYFISRLSQTDLDSITLRLTLEVVDEDITEDYSMSIEIAEQELPLPESEVHEYEKDNGEIMELQSAPGWTIEECVSEGDVDPNADIISVNSPFFDEEEFRFQIKGEKSNSD